MAITPLPPAPLPSDTPQDFNEKAFAVVSALNEFVTETNLLALSVSDLENSANESAALAATKASEAVLEALSAQSHASAADASAVSAADSAIEALSYQQGAQDIADYVASIGSYKLPILKNNGATSIVTVLGSTLPVVNRAGFTVDVSLTT